MQARQIYQKALDAMTAAMIARDSAAFLHHIHLPQQMTTVDGSITFSEPATLARTFDRYLGELERRGIDRIERFCIAARQEGEDRLVGYHLTRLYAGERLATDPFTTRLVFLRGKNGDWKNSQSDSSVARSDWPILPGQAKDTPPAGVRKRDFAAYGIFQDMLNVVTQHYLTGDLEHLHSIIQYPLQLLTRRGMQVLEGFEDLKAEFALYMKEFRLRGVTDMVRNVHSAEFTHEGLITGHFRTYILGGDRMIVDPYDSTMTLALCDDRIWRMSSVLHALGHMNWLDARGVQ